MSVSALKAVGIFATALALGACTIVGPDYHRPPVYVPLEYKEIKGWKPGVPLGDFVRGPWWKTFDDPELDRLEAMVAVSNQTLKADEANYRQALALIAEARSGQFPTINFDPSLTRASSAAGVGWNLSAQLTGSWTLDVWGKIHRQIESDAAAAQVSAADLANARLSAQSTLAIAYVQMRQSESTKALLLDAVAQYEKTLRILQNQVNAEVGSPLDLVIAKTQVETARAQAINQDVTRSTNEHAIAVLAGLTPSQLGIPRAGLRDRAYGVPVEVPSTLLERRPDIAAAERKMQEQNALIGVAFAGYYPDITLSGAFGYSGNPFVKQIAGANPVWNYALTLAQPLFEGGLTQAQVEAAKASYAGSVATYRQTVLTAFQQVEDALSTLRILNEQARVQSLAVRDSRLSVQKALNQYQAGTQNYTTVVTAEATALTNEEAAVTLRAQRMTAAINLVVALGGGWSDALLPNLTKLEKGPETAVMPPLNLPWAPWAVK